MFSDPKKVVGQVHIDFGMTVADFGSGAGSYSLLLSEIVGPSGKVFAFDVQKDLLSNLKNEAARQGKDNIMLYWTDLDEANSTSLKDQTVDRVFIINVLFQAEDKKAFIREAKRILKPNGKVVMVDWADSFGGVGPREADVLKQDIAKRYFYEEGFVEEKMIDAGAHHYGFVFKINKI